MSAAVSVAAPMVEAIATPISTPVAVSATPVMSQVSPIPSMMTMTKEIEEAMATFAKSSTKYKLTEMPESKCDGRE